MNVALSLPQSIAEQCMAMTCPVWQSRPGERSEPFHEAYRRIVGREAKAPMCVAALQREGRFITVNLHPGGVAVVHDPLRGWQIRLLKPGERNEKLGNMAHAIRHVGAVPLALVKSSAASGQSLSTTVKAWAL